METSEVGPAGVLPLPLVVSEETRRSYESASPWRHIVVDRLLDPELVLAAEREELAPALELKVRRTARLAKAESAEPSGPAAKSIMRSWSSPEFISYLESLTGIEDLTPDPTHDARGLHVFPSGGFQAVHRDFRLQPVTRMFHRLTVLLYLNSDWSAEFGGELELWDAHARSCVRSIEPVAGRMVILEPGPHAIHGIPDPVRCPPDRARLSLICSYFTTTPAPDDRREPRVLRPKRPQDPWHLRFMPVRDATTEFRHRVRRWFERSS